MENTPELENDIAFIKTLPNAELRLMVKHLDLRGEHGPYGKHQEMQQRLIDWCATHHGIEAVWLEVQPQIMEQRRLKREEAEAKEAKKKNRRSASARKGWQTRREKAEKAKQAKVRPKAGSPAAPLFRRLF
jgi:hypothetical protein